MPIFTGAVNSNWGTAGNWDTGVLPSATGAGTDAIFNASSPNCTVNITTAVCRNLNFTGYTGTITMTNAILVGSAAAANPNHAVTLSAGMGIAGTGAIVTRANGTTTLTSNGRAWPNTLAINNSFVAANSVATITGNWTVGNLVLGPATNHAMTLNGAFTITVNGNFSLPSFGTVSRVIATAGSLTTIKLAGTGTWSTGATFASTATAAIGFGPSIVIDTTGTITIANGCYFGGSASVAGTNFTYVTGTVIHSGIFHLLGNQGGNGYSVNLNGSSSPSATTTSSTGVNFQNLSFTTFSVGASPGACAITGNLCVVGNLSITALSATKGMALTTGGTIYVGGNLTVVGAMRVASSTVVVLQGTGTWTENTITLGVGFGISWQVQINTTGTITVASNIGLTDSGSITYTAGTFTWGTGNTLYMTAQAALYGLGTYGVIIDNLIHYTNAAVGGGGSLIYFYDTAPIRFGTISLLGTNANFAWVQQGTIGWTCDSFSCYLNSTTTNTALRLAPSVEYKINTSLIMQSWTSSNNFGIAPLPGGITKWTLAYGAYQDMYYINGGSGATISVDSSEGQTIWTRGGAISANTLNWKNWDYPRTRHSTFISN